MRTAIYPGTFDPLTNGHVSLIRRGLEVFDRVIVAIAKDTSKEPLFTLQERVDMARKVFEGESRVVAEAFEGLLVDYVAASGANIILRGLRAVSDFEYELQMALMNRRLNREIQTVFMMTDYKWLFTSSTLIKETARLGGRLSGIVPDEVLACLQDKFGRCAATNNVGKE